MLDLLIRNAALATGGDNADIAVKDGKIIEIADRIDAESTDTIDAAGNLVTPPFIDPHFHMDATLSLGLPRLNESGTLLEGIQLWSELKPHLTIEAIKERAHKLLKWSPEVSIEEGLRRSVEWYRQNREVVLPLELGDR